jgi:hypothetical protein
MGVQRFAYPGKRPRHPSEHYVMTLHIGLEGWFNSDPFLPLSSTDEASA